MKKNKVEIDAADTETRQLESFLYDFEKTLNELKNLEAEGYLDSAVHLFDDYGRAMRKNAILEARKLKDVSKMAMTIATRLLSRLK